jgi:hypothetical protein
VPTAVPRIEIADHSHPRGVRRPDGKADAVNATDGPDLRAEGLAQFEMAALVEQKKIQVSEQRPERIRILGLLDCLRPTNAKEIRRGIADESFKQPAFVGGFERRQVRLVGPSQNFHLARTREEGADHAPVRIVMWAQHAEGVGMQRVCNSMHRVQIELPPWSEFGLRHRELRALCQQFWQ